MGSCNVLSYLTRKNKNSGYSIPVSPSGIPGGAGILMLQTAAGLPEPYQ